MLSFANVLWPFRFRASESTGHIPVVYCNASSHASVSGMKQLPSESSISVSDESDCDLSESLHRSLPLLWHLKEHTHTYIKTLEYTNRCAKIIKCEWTCAFPQCSHQQTSNRLWYLAAQEKKGQASYCAHRVSGFVFMSFVQDLGVISLNVFMPPRLYVLLHQWLIAAQLFWSSHLVFSV